MDDGEGWISNWTSISLCCVWRSYPLSWAYQMFSFVFHSFFPPPFTTTRNVTTNNGNTHALCLWETFFPHTVSNLTQPQFWRTATTATLGKRSQAQLWISRTWVLALPKLWSETNTVAFPNNLWRPLFLELGISLLPSRIPSKIFTLEPQSLQREVYAWLRHSRRTNVYTIAEQHHCLSLVYSRSTLTLTLACSVQRTLSCVLLTELLEMMSVRTFSCGGNCVKVIGRKRWTPSNFISIPRKQVRQLAPRESDEHIDLTPTWRQLCLCSVSLTELCQEQFWEELNPWLRYVSTKAHPWKLRACLSIKTVWM